MNLKQTFANLSLTIKKHSPVILQGLGVVGVGATAYFVYKAAPKVEHIIEEAKLDKEAAGGQLPPMLKKRVAKQLAYELAPPVATGVATIGCFLWSYNIQAGRITALSGAFTAVSRELQESKDRYLEQYGEEAYDKFYGPTIEIERTILDGKGKEKTVKEEALPEGPLNLMSGVWFDKSIEYNKDDHDYNLAWVESKISQIELKMFQRGHLLVNEVLDILGIERCRQGALLGWSTNAGLRPQVFHIWDEESQVREPQIFIGWSQPKYVYDDIEYGDAYRW